MICNPAIVKSGGASGLVTAIIEGDKASYKVVGYPGESVRVIVGMQEYTVSITSYTAVDSNGNSVTLQQFMAGHQIAGSQREPGLIVQFDMPDVDVTVTLKGEQG